MSFFSEVALRKTKKKKEKKKNEAAFQRRKQLGEHTNYNRF